MTPRRLLGLSPVIPVMVVADAALAADMAAALVDGGLRVLEVTLRSAAGYEALRRIRDALPQALVGAGSVLGPQQWQRALDHGAQFGVSPGLRPALAGAVHAAGLPFIPGVATASEAMQAAEQGFEVLKLFPAQAAGGCRWLRSMHGPLPRLRFCPTGGIDAESAAHYLALPNVDCVGGTWLTPADAVAARDWSRIRELAHQASRLQRPGLRADTDTP